MNKLAHYLNQHLHGEVLVDSDTLHRYATDNGPLRQEPEMVAFPLETSDIRKLLRFSWQLASKGHRLAVTARGAGQNGTSGALSSGVVLSLPEHMNRIFEYDAKQRLVRLQPGVTAAELDNALRLQGTSVDALGRGSQTVGGLLADTSSSRIGEVVEQMEVVLVNGDTLQTKRLSKRELSRAKGLQNFEAEIYREIDGLLSENAELIEKLDTRNAGGYHSLAQVKHKDGSLDLTPLFLGSQGTLGVVSEVILRADFVGDQTSVVVAAFADPAAARDALDGLDKSATGAQVEYYDARLVAKARAEGKTYEFIGEMNSTPTLLVVRLADIGSRTRARKAKKLQKHLEKAGAVVTSTDTFETSDFRSLESIRLLAARDGAKSAQAVADDAFVPLERSEDFMSGLFELEKKLKIDLPVYGKPFENLWTVRPVVAMDTVGGKQTLLKFIDQYRQLVERCGGYVAGVHGEGRVQLLGKSDANADEFAELFARVKQIFDPHGILNAGAKQPGDVRKAVKQLRGEASPRRPSTTN